MKIHRAYILELLKARGRNDKAAEAAACLPEHVDTEEHLWVLAKFGIRSRDLVGYAPSVLQLPTRPLRPSPTQPERRGPKAPTRPGRAAPRPRSRASWTSIGN